MVRRLLQLVPLCVVLASSPAVAQLERWTNNAASTLASGIGTGDGTLTVATGEGA